MVELDCLVVKCHEAKRSFFWVGERVKALLDALNNLVKEPIHYRSGRNVDAENESGRSRL
jgi:hypothetical protein